MNLYHASKPSMNIVTPLRRQQHTIPEISDYKNDGAATINNTHDDRKTESSTVQMTLFTNEKSEQQRCCDLYTPLAPEEADEDQLAEFFKALDVDVLFGECCFTLPLLLTDDDDKIEVASNSDITTTERHASKRIRMSSGGDSFSSSYSKDTYDYDETRKRSKSIRNTFLWQQ